MILAFHQKTVTRTNMIQRGSEMNFRIDVYK